MSQTPGDAREIRDENGDLLVRVTEEHPGTVLRALRCESRSEARQVLDYPEAWRKLTDRQLYRLCQSGERLDG